MYIRTWVNAPKYDNAPRINEICIDERKGVEDPESQVYVAFHTPGNAMSNVFQGVVAEVHMTCAEAEELIAKLTKAVNAKTPPKPTITYTGKLL